jgi:hypothetical protein
MALSDAQKLEIQAHKTYLSGVIKDSQSEYSKQLLSLSSGVLALSVAFLKNLVSIALAIWLPLLYAAWALLLLTIFVTLIAIKISIKAHQIYKDDLDKMLAGRTDTVGETWRDRLMPCFSWISSSCFAFGILLLVVFSVINIQKEKTMPNQTYADPQTNTHTRTHTGIGRDRTLDHVEVQRINVPTVTPPAQTPAVTPTVTPAEPAPSCEPATKK